MTAKKAPAKKIGRPSEYRKATGDAICLRLADGESLRRICSSDGMPSRTTVFKWLDDNPEFLNQYARAREAQADLLAAEVVEIADEDAAIVMTGEDGEPVAAEFDATAVARNRLRVDARKWYASKLAPKKYGEKLAVSGDDDGAPLQVIVKTYSAPAA